MTASRLSLCFTLPFALAGCPSDDTGGTGSETETNATTGMTSPSTSVTSPSTTTMATTTGMTTDESTGEPTGGTTTGGATETGTTSGGIVCDPDVVELPGDMFFPEGISAHSDGTLFVGSLTSGEIVRITPCVEPDEEDVIDTFYDGADTMAAVGLLVDEDNNMLWVCNSDFTFVAAPSIQGFNLDDGTLAVTHSIDAGVCNDLAMDDVGNLYATESGASRIMRVPAANLLADSDAEEWSADAAFQVAPGELGLNGIVFDGADAIYTVNLTSGELYSVTLQGGGGTAGAAQVIDLGGAMLLGPDGLELEAADTFLVVENAAPALTRVTVGAAATVEVVHSDFDVPTTAAIVGTDVWVVESQLDHLLDPMGAGPPEPPFVIVRRTL
jgi:sugar lactone lactonase YvrE